MAIGEHMRFARNGAGWTLIVLLAMTAGCEQGATDEKTAAGEVAAIPVETALPIRGDIDAMYTGTAPIEAFADATVIAKVGGEVREILVEEADDVSRGQLLARLDGDRLRLEMEQAEANLHKLQRDFKRNVDLRDKGLISEGDFEKIQYEMEALEAIFDLAKLEYSYTEIRAPIDGVVSERFIKLGNTIDVNAPTFQITSLEPLVSYLHVPEREYRRIDPGQPAIIQVDALQGLTFEADVARVSPIVDPGTGTFKITIEVSDPSRRLKPGMFGRIGIVYDSHLAALQIPRSAIVEEAGESAVYVVTGDTVEKRIVRTGYAQAGYVEIVEGLRDREEIVIVGQMNLKDGSRVTVINGSGAAGMAANTGLAET